MRPLSRILIAAASLSLGLTYFLPVWFIYLLAPQYPEGLTMNIWLNHLSGQVEIINGLNHYIGMKHINESMFPEFGYLGIIMGAFIVLGLAVAAGGRRKHLSAYLLLLLVAAGAALYDFYQWGYDYGHHLDPKAAIQVPGLYYQPPLVGHKKLLNFDAYSYPDTGGWIVIGAGALCFAVWGWERFGRRRVTATGAKKRAQIPVAAIVLAAAIGLSSCHPGPQAFRIGRDACSDCKMTIMDARFGGELITAKGRVYPFDDLHCLAHFRRQHPDIAQGADLYFSDHSNGQLLPAGAAWTLRDKSFNSPMGSHAASFASKAAASSVPNALPVAGADILNQL
ncbi:hypothetical protein GCM10028786_18440 [Flaviaesturariibacter terrae]